MCGYMRQPWTMMVPDTTPVLLTLSRRARRSHSQAFWNSLMPTTRSTGAQLQVTLCTAKADHGIGGVAGAIKFLFFGGFHVVWRKDYENSASRSISLYSRVFCSPVGISIGGRPYSSGHC